ncbi:G_PROTEIN_RECEP_F1_2 domain-containing protein [Caenorhabditis elegans]|uniref:G_PROTEIN_RECEP_F1_2 domain-containing protein n=1 Tax=Caenorhabditis elegans TaxID=6239 RepID=Q965Z7_CAEEL|nr:G_PROTEIN_RECEP_F1_2 domain-containing protein [Caenorhabditis elegans]CCD64287.1 G_PROTEIN_RECEP_F1_2 domain-containing protein [Caenorhabditis elegans]|eukprot:NP_504994.3 Serpentine Receptor, class SX [Caenorhabditis elegans]
MYLSIPRSFGAVAFTIMPLILTIDRIIATCTPIQYKNLKHCEVYYIGFLLVFPVIYALWILGFAILQQDTENSSNICVLSNCFGDAYYLYKVSTFSFAIILFPLQYFVNYRMKAMEYDSTNISIVQALIKITVMYYFGAFLSYSVMFMGNIYFKSTLESIQIVKLTAGIISFSTQSFTLPLFCYTV